MEKIKMMLSLFLAVLCLVGCLGDGGLESAPSTESDRGTDPAGVIEIGGILPPFGSDARLGAEIAVEEINALGGVALSLESDGDATQPQMEYPTAAYGEFSAGYIAKNALGTKVAVVADEGDPESVAVSDAFIHKAESAGLKVVAKESFTADTFDGGALIQRADGAGADVLFLPIGGDFVSKLLSEADSAGYLPVIFGTDGTEDMLRSDSFDAVVAEGVMYVGSFSSSGENGRAAAFSAKYREKHSVGKEPTSGAAAAYDAVYAVYEAIKLSGVTPDASADALAEAIFSVLPKVVSPSVLSPDGELIWNSQGEPQMPTPTVYIIHSGESERYE